jgi:hypothetical protein
MDGSIRHLTGRHKAAQMILKWRDNVDDDDKGIHYFRLEAQAQFSKIITIIYCLPAAGAGSKDGMFSE